MYRNAHNVAMDNYVVGKWRVEAQTSQDTYACETLRNIGAGNFSGLYGETEQEQLLCYETQKALRRISYNLQNETISLNGKGRLIWQLMRKSQQSVQRLKHWE